MTKSRRPPVLVKLWLTGAPVSLQYISYEMNLRSTPVAFRSSVTWMLCRSLTEPCQSMTPLTVPVFGSTFGSKSTGIVSVYVNGTPTLAVVVSGGFCLSIFSTGIRMF